MAHDPVRVRLLTSMIDLAHDFGMRVTVEGIETAEQDRLVRRLGADHGQGAHYATPDAAGVVGALLERPHQYL